MSSYTIESKPASNNGWDTPTEARRRYGRYSRDGVTVHWWDSPDRAGDHDQTVSYILGQAAAGNMSVHYVVSDAKVTMLVHPDNVAWHATRGNPTTIGIEFDPRLGDIGYKRGGWLVGELESRYGKRLVLHKHSDWAGTSCPGTIDLGRLRREADSFGSSNTQQGGTSMDKVDLSAARILAHGVLGRNGLAGRSNALDGSSDADLNKNHVGKNLTAAYIQGLYQSPEAVRWRDSQDANAVHGINKRLADKQPPANPQDAEDAKKLRAIKEALK